MSWLSKGGRDTNKIWHKGSLDDEDDVWTSNTRIAQGKARDTTLDDEKYDIRYTRWWQVGRLI